MSKIYTASELFLIQDKSEDKSETWEFVDRRIADVMRVGQLVNSNQAMVQAVGSGVLSIF